MPDRLDPLEASNLATDGLRLLRAGRLPEALDKLKEAIRLRPDHHDAHANLGVAYGRLRQQAEAEQAFRDAIRVRPDFATTHANLGTACFDQGKFALAERSFRRAIELAPQQADFQRHLGTALEAQGQDPAAEEAYRNSLKLNAGQPDTHFRLGKLLAKKGSNEEAESCFREATRLQPDQASYWNFLGGVLEAANKSSAAEAAYRVAVGLEPNNAESHNNLGVALAAQNRLLEAEASYRKALDIDPRLAMAFNNLGNNLRSQDRLDEAEASLKQAIQLQPRYAEAHNNLGIIYIQRRQTQEGLKCYEEALRLKPDYAEAHLNRALSLLAKGDFERGWQEYEWRFRMRHRKPPTADGLRWDGSPLNGRRLLLRAEQGLGDCVQFMRYGAVIPRGSGGRVILECPENLIELASTCPGIDELVVRGANLPACDLFCPLLSVPAVLGITFDTIPAEIPYLEVDSARSEYWRIELDALPGCRIGISWQGSQDHRGDSLRSMPLTRFAALANLRGVSLCSLQKGHGTEQITDGSAKDLLVHDFGSKTASSFADTAALMRGLDLVVTVDTALAHVAGALGVPVWVLTPFASDWRWLQDRDDSPWYPTLRLFRQPKRGDWDSVFARIAQMLESWPARLRGLRKGR